MKRLYVLALSLLLIVGLTGLTACGGNDTAPTTTTETPAPTATPTPTPEPTPAPTVTQESDDEDDEAEGEGSNNADPAGNISSQIIGEWRMSSTGDPTQLWGLENGWEYDIYFLSDGTGIEWWNSPETGWHEVTNFTWSASGGQITLTYTGIDVDIIDHYLGEEVGDLMEYTIGFPIVGTYSLTGNTLTFVLGGVTYVYQRNITSQIIGEWHMTSTSDPISAWGLENDWGYDIYFLGDNTGIEWWNSPETGWHEVANFTWSASGGQITITYIGIDVDVIDHYLGQEVGDLMEYAIGVPIVGTYSVTGNTLTLVLEGITNVYQRN